MITSDFVIIGGGIMGISVSRELKRRHPDAKVILIEKEKKCGEHASSRNSGVLHAGFYYTSNTLKAKFTQEGNKLLTDYCKRKRIRINRCGKLVVCRDASDLPKLQELEKRALANGVPIEVVDEKHARKIEPRAITFEKALFSPTTSSVNPLEVLASMTRDARNEGIDIREGIQYLTRSNGCIKTSDGEYSAGYVINCSGLYADQVARDYGFSRDYRILPFKGLYLYSEEPAHSFRTHVYPVPDLRNPFLGVHLTMMVDGRAKIGPTAIPALWRENYQGLERFKMSEFLDVISREAGLFFFSGFDFKKLAFEEMQKYSKTVMVRLASRLVEGIKEVHYKVWGKPGIRAQLVDIKKKKLEMDFVVEGDKKSFHVLNAVSPGFTCSIPFAKFVCDQMEALRN